MLHMPPENDIHFICKLQIVKKSSDMLELHCIVGSPSKRSWFYFTNRAELRNHSHESFHISKCLALDINTSHSEAQQNQNISNQNS